MLKKLIAGVLLTVLVVGSVLLIFVVRIDQTDTARNVQLGWYVVTAILIATVVKLLEKRT